MMGSKFWLLTIAALIVCSAGFGMYYAGQSEVRQLIAQQKANSYPYHWLKEGLDYGGWTAQQEKRIKLQLRMLERDFKRQAKAWAAQGTTLAGGYYRISVPSEYVLANVLDFDEVERSAWEAIQMYHAGLDQEIVLKATVYADFKKSFVWGLSGYSSHHAPHYLVLFEGNFARENSIAYSYAVLTVNPNTGKVTRTSLSNQPMLEDYEDLRKIEYEADRTRIYTHGQGMPEFME